MEKINFVLPLKGKFFFFFDRLEREVMGCQFAAFFRYNPKGKIYVSIKEI